MSELLKCMMGADYALDLADYNSVAAIVVLQTEVLAAAISEIESVLVTGQPGRADTIETELVCARRAAAHRAAK